MEGIAIRAAGVEDYRGIRAVWSCPGVLRDTLGHPGIARRRLDTVFHREYHDLQRGERAPMGLPDKGRASPHAFEGREAP